MSAAQLNPADRKLRRVVSTAQLKPSLLSYKGVMRAAQLNPADRKLRHSSPSLLSYKGVMSTAQLNLADPKATRSARHWFFAQSLYTSESWVP